MDLKDLHEIYGKTGGELITPHRIATQIERAYPDAPATMREEPRLPNKMVERIIEIYPLKQKHPVLRRLG